MTFQDIAKAYSYLLLQNKFKNIKVTNGMSWSLDIPIIGKYYMEINTNEPGGTSDQVFVFGTGGEFGAVGTTGRIYHYSATPAANITYKTMAIKNVYKYGFALDFTKGTVSIFESGILIYTINVAAYGSMNSLISAIGISNYWGSANTIVTADIITRDKEFLYSIPDGYISLHDLLVGSECYKDKENKLYGIK